MKIGLIGLDTSHSEIFTKLLNDQNESFHVKGGMITHAIPVYSDDLPISRERFPTYRKLVEEKYGVQLMTDVEQFMKEIDAVIIGTVDGRNHLYWFEQVVKYRKPIFIDKPMVMSSKEMKKVIELVNKYGTPVMSASSLRYSDSVKKLKTEGLAGFESAYFYGPLPMQEAMPGYFWYGIHMIEQLSSLLGPDWSIERRDRFTGYEVLHLVNGSGKNVYLRGDEKWHNQFGGVMHFNNRTEVFELWNEEKPYYANLLEEIILFFQRGNSPVSLEEMTKIIELVERINYFPAREVM